MLFTILKAEEAAKIAPSSAFYIFLYFFKYLVVAAMLVEHKAKKLHMNVVNFLSSKYIYRQK